MKFTDIIASNIDPYKLRKKNFFKGIFKDRNKNLKELNSLITNKHINCPICNGKKIDQNYLKIDKNYKLKKCSNCNLIFPNTKFNSDKDYVKKVYTHYSKQNHRKILYGTQKYRKATFIEDRYKYCIDRIFKNKKINVLEYGCGNGLFLAYLKKKKIKCKGLEVDPYQIKIAQNNGLNVTNTEIKNEKNNEYNLCVMFDVLEHLTHPINQLKLINKKIKKGGYVVCYSPNIYSIAFELMKKNQNQVYTFEHLFFFAKKTLKILAKKTGFKIVSYETFGLDLVDFFLYKEFTDKKRYISKFKDFINLLQPVIDKNEIGNHFRLTLKKK